MPPGRAAVETIEFNQGQRINQPHLKLVVDNTAAEAATTAETFPRPSDRYKGRVAIEGLQARYDAVTEYAELVDGQMYTPLELTSDGDDLYGPDGRSLTESAAIGLEKAKEAAAANPNLSFEVDRRSHEREEIEEAKQMVKNYLNGVSDKNTLAVTSDYPLALQNTGAKAPGYNDERQQAMDRIITVSPEGKVMLYSQSLDESNRQALEAMDRSVGFETQTGEMLGQRRQLALTPEEQSTLSHRRRDIYDDEMARQFGGEWFAGRRPVDYRNTYEFVCRPEQRDLVEMYVDLKLSGELTDKIMYDLAATMNVRFDHYKAAKKEETAQIQAMPDLPVFEQSVRASVTLYDEVRSAGMMARRAGKSFSGCGSTYTAEGLDESTETALEKAGYGERSGDTKSWHGGKKYKGSRCVSCQKVKPEVGACHICEDCVKHPKGKVRTVQDRTDDPKKAKVNREPAKVYSLEEARQAREKRQTTL